MRKYVAYLAPSMLGTVTLYAVPFALMLWVAFAAGDPAVLWKKTAFCTALRNTACYLLGGISLSLLLGFCIALWLEIKSYAMCVLLLCPLLLPAPTIAVLCQRVFTQDNWLSSAAGLPILTAMLVWKLTGIDAVLLSAAHRRIPPEIIESARLDGASAWQLLRRVEWPYLCSSVFFAVLVDIFFAWRAFREIYLLTGDYPYDGIYLIQHYLTHMFRGLNIPHLSQASWLLTLAVIAVIGTLFLLANHCGKDVEE
ncbi:MAG: sugar ABC transporter permease [Clostridiales bacterium]|nr:sugar ABC transporter permease [Candidatus Cacconaster stercorequi]